MGHLSLAERVALAVLPKITGFCSLAFSFLLVVTILRDQNRRRLCYHRLMLGVSLSDMSASLWFALSTWPIPTGTQNDAVWAIGNETSCQVQGFFTQASICSSFYNASLSIYFWLIIVKGWNEQMLKRIEWFFHAIPLSWAIVSALTGLIMDVYRSANLWCWVSSDEEVFRLVAFYGPLWMNIFIVSLTCAAVYLHIRKIEHESERHGAFRDAYSRQAAELAELGCENMKGEATSATLDGNQSSVDNREMILASFRKQQAQNHTRNSYHSKRIKDVAHQCFLYAVAFYVNWLALTAQRLIQVANDDLYYPLVLVAAITVPMQGLPNFLVYLRPRLQKIRQSNPSTGWMKRFVRSIARNDNVSISMASVERGSQNGDHDQETATNEVFEPNREQQSR
eukprot:scaffold38456_cov176-Amphora_coffeaeformis.AAC.3